MSARLMTKAERKFLRQFALGPRQPHHYQPPQRPLPKVRAVRPVAVPIGDRGDIEAMCAVFYPEAWTPEEMVDPRLKGERDDLRHRMVNVLAVLKGRGWKPA